MNHWIVAPVLLPLLAGILLLLSARWGLALQRALSLVATALLIPLCAWLLAQAASGEVQAYALGNWPAPFGIVLVLDRLSALMVMLTAVVALFALTYALIGKDAAGKNFHVLFQLQLLGLNGAFLTGDLFNLFVFFEILLIASYGLLLHGGGRLRTRAGLHYVVLNLAGSGLFLIAVGTLYGITGTLNMADLAVRVAEVPVAHTAVLQAAALLLLVVFALKAALLPLYFWLPSAYSNTSAPVAALFAIMTKVGVYAIVRVYTLVFGPEAGVAADVAAPWLLPVALATLAAGVLGALASRGLRNLVAYLVVVSVGMLLTAVGLFSVAGMSAALVYLVHTTLVTAAMFLVADLIAAQRGGQGDQFSPAPQVAQPMLLGMLFFAGAIALAGLPPLSGFLGKLMILEAARETPAVAWVWGVVLVGSLIGIVALARAGSALFWKTEEKKLAAGQPRARLLGAAAAVALLAFSPLLIAFGGPLVGFAGATAEQLFERSGYIHSVLGPERAVVRSAQGGQP